MDKEQYIKKYKFLFEYNIKAGVKLDEVETSEENDLPPSIEADMESQVPPANPEVEFENTEEVEKIKKEEQTDDLAKISDLDRVKEIQDMQTAKLEELENFIQSLNSQVEDVKEAAVDIDNIKANIEILKQHVDDITPPTPEESIQRMAKISGGISIEDYWKDYFKDNKPYRQLVDMETQEDPEELKRRIEAKRKEEMDNIVNKTLSMSDSQVKDSFNKF